MENNFRWQLSPEALFSKVDDEVIIMSLASDRYIGLDPVGSRIWELLSNPLTLDELCAQLLEEYNVDASVCRQDTLELLETLRNKGLVLQLPA